MPSGVSPRIELFDFTLPALDQMPGVLLSNADRLAIAQKIDSLGVDYITLGSVAEDSDFIKRHGKELSFSSARGVVTSPVRRPSTTAGRDQNLRALVRSSAAVGSLFATSWDTFVSKAQRTTLQENLEMVVSSIRYVKSHLEEVIFIAEHFFDGFRNNETYALSVVGEARRAGADVVVLADSNGGALPSVIETATSAVVDAVGGRIGIRASNDCELGVSNSLQAVESGASHVQGAVNGYGARCGAANIISVAAILSSKTNAKTLNAEHRRRASEVASFVAELSNRQLDSRQPFVGADAFATKANLRVSVSSGASSGAGAGPASSRRNLFEHMDPSDVGNVRHLLIREASEKSTIVVKAAQLGVEFSETAAIGKVAKRVRNLERLGYHFDAADASFELMLRSATGLDHLPFKAKGARVVTQTKSGGATTCEATVEIELDGQRITETQSGDSVVAALQGALCAALAESFPKVADIAIADYKVRLLDTPVGSVHAFRVLLSAGDGHRSWDTIGVSSDVVAATFDALVDAYVYGLMRGEVS